MDNSCLVKQAYDAKSTGKRGRPKERWLNHFLEDLKETKWDFWPATKNQLLWPATIRLCQDHQDGLIVLRTLLHCFNGNLFYKLGVDNTQRERERERERDP